MNLCIKVMCVSGQVFCKQFALSECTFPLHICPVHHFASCQEAEVPKALFTSIIVLHTTARLTRHAVKMLGAVNQRFTCVIQARDALYNMKLSTRTILFWLDANLWHDLI